MEVYWEEADVDAVIRMSMQTALPGVDLSASETVYVHESVLLDIMEAGVPQNDQEAQHRFGDLFQTMGDSSWDSQDLCDFCRVVLRQLEALDQSLRAEAERAESGCCSMCDRDMHLTRHHLIPREFHTDLKKKLPKDVLAKTIAICRPCHNAIHNFVENKDLASTFNTLDKLMEVDKIRSFVAWASKQPSKPKAPGGGKMLQQKR